jgi:chorismate mutase
MVRGIRGAIQVAANTRESIHNATRELLNSIFVTNDVDIEQIASIFITATPDLNADFPAYAAREMGLTSVPLMCTIELDIPGAMQQVIRVLVHINTDKSQSEIKHQYLGEAAKLRPDLSGENE